MKFLTDAQANQLTLEFEADVEKDFRRGGSFYASTALVVDADVVAYAREEFDVDIVERLGWCIWGSGYWSDDDGLDMNSFGWSKPVLVHVPEKVVVTPAHTLTVFEPEND